MEKYIKSQSRDVIKTHTNQQVLPHRRYSNLSKTSQATMFTKTTSLFALLLSTGLVLALPVDQASKAVDARPPVRKIEVSTKGWKREEPEVDAGEWAANYRIPVNRKDWAETTAEEGKDSIQHPENHCLKYMLSILP